MFVRNEHLSRCGNLEVVPQLGAGDGGYARFYGSLARKYYQQRLDTIRVFDPNTNSQVIYRKPRNETILVGLQTH